MTNYILTVWTQQGQALQFTGATEELTLLKLRYWMNGGGEKKEPFRVDGLTCKNCPAPHDVVLGWDERRGKWYVDWPGSTWQAKVKKEQRPLRTPNDWKAATSRSSSRRCFKDFGAAAGAFLDACACRVMDLRVKCRCADCGREMVRAYAPHIPMVGHVCYDCLTYYVGLPIFLPDPLVEKTT